MDREPLLLLGASVRAAAFSASRAGFAPLAADLFADVDLHRLCPAVRVAQYPQGLLSAAEGFPAAAWMYTGALENHPDLVDRLASRRPLLGNRGEVLRAVRDPFRASEVLARDGLPVPATVPADARVPQDGSWLLKPVRSSGGGGVQVWRGQRTRSDRPFILQQRVDGQPCAALYVAAGGDTVLLGVSEQLVGTAWCGARGFQYAGSVGPLPLGDTQHSGFQRIGQCLAREFGLVGLFGVDAVMASADVWPVEVNPRYTASMEILERSLGVHAVRYHVDACRHGRLPLGVPKSSSVWCGKAILYARSIIEIAGALAEELAAAAESSKAQRWPAVADIPAADSRISQGRPLMTVLASDVTREGVLTKLTALAAHWDQRFHAAYAGGESR
jgi:predicted ATP-grasp superfamily ATP-dependent carboligase